MGDRYLRQLFVIGMTARVRAARARPERVDPWTASISERKPTRRATMAMANKTARNLGRANKERSLQLAENGVGNNDTTTQAYGQSVYKGDDSDGSLVRPGAEETRIMSRT